MTSIRKVLLASGSILLGAMTLPACAQSAPEPLAADPTDDQTAPADRVVVLGSQIAGAEITGALPVTVVDAEDIAATGAVSAEDLFRTIPQAGDITFAGTYLGGGNSNAARGDISTVSLRGLAQGNTLALINGRRSVLHPTSQTDNQTPVFGYNVNAVPVAGLARVEVLKDGAAALYGSDAVAGVVNNVLQDDFQGLNIDLQYGFAEDTNLKETSANLLWGSSFLEGKGNISVFVGATNRTSLLASDQPYTASADRRGFVVGTPWEGAVIFDARGTGSAWGVFTPRPGTVAGAVNSNGTVFTDVSGAFHVQPTTGFANCRLPTPANTSVCYGPGTTTAAAYREMRLDSFATFANITTLPSVDRYNAFSFINYDINENLRLFGELGYYNAQTNAVIGPGGSLGSAPITIAANAFWNPLGPTGSANRLPALNVSAAGVPLTITSYTLVDAGTRSVVVDNAQYRAVLGLKGDAFGWNWETAAVYSEASVRDKADGYSSTLFQAAINRTTNLAYNPFSGGNPLDPDIGDSSISNAGAIESFRVKQVRKNYTTLAMVDFKVSKPDLLTYWAGDIGIAAGLEYRRETYFDDRDPRQDGTIQYVDSVTGLLSSTSDLMGHSPSPDVKGDRNTTSAYVELAVPLISQDWNIPLVQRVDLQIAGRYEDFSDVGSVAKPKVAASWEVTDSLKLRGSWSEGFKAPNLEVINTPLLERVNAYPDYIQCEADLRAGRITTYSQCATLGVTVASLRSGNADLKPEESTSYSYGAVFQPAFLPEAAGSLTATIDVWHIEQENVIGLLTDDVALNIDYLQRLQGSSNPLVLRKPPTPQQIANFTGTGLAPVGDVLNVIAKFTNLAPLEVEGIDYGVFWEVDVGPGQFNIGLNASNLTTYFQSPTAEAELLLAAKAAGQINAAVPVTGAASLIQQNGRPEWKGSLSLSYEVDNWEFGTFTQYTGLVYQTAVLNAQNKPWKVQDQYTTNAYVQYSFNGEWLNNGRLRLGVRNISNEDPPFANGDTGGWLSSLYQPMPRYWYVDFKKSF